MSTQIRSGGGGGGSGRSVKKSSITTVGVDTTVNYHNKKSDNIKSDKDKTQFKVCMLGLVFFLIYRSTK